MGGVSGDEAALGCAGTPSLPSFPAFRPSYSVAPSRRGSPAAGGIQPRARCGKGGGSREETPVPQPGLPGSRGAGGAGGAPATQEAGEVRGEPGVDGKWGLTQRVNPSPAAFCLISFISSHPTCLLCRVLPPGRMPLPSPAPGSGEVELPENQGSGRPHPNPTESGVRRHMPPPKPQELRGLINRRRKNQLLPRRNLPRNF